MCRLSNPHLFSLIYEFLMLFVAHISSRDHLLSLVHFSSIWKAIFLTYLIIFYIAVDIGLSSNFFFDLWFFKVMTLLVTYFFLQFVSTRTISYLKFYIRLNFWGFDSTLINCLQRFNGARHLCVSICDILIVS